MANFPKVTVLPLVEFVATNFSSVYQKLIIHLLPHWLNSPRRKIQHWTIWPILQCSWATIDSYRAQNVGPLLDMWLGLLRRPLLTSQLISSLDTSITILPSNLLLLTTLGAICPLNTVADRNSFAKLLNCTCKTWFVVQPNNFQSADLSIILMAVINNQDLVSIIHRPSDGGRHWVWCVCETMMSWIMSRLSSSCSFLIQHNAKLRSNYKSVITSDDTWYVIAWYVSNSCHCFMINATHEPQLCFHYHCLNCQWDISKER